MSRTKSSKYQSRVYVTTTLETYLQIPFNKAMKNIMSRNKELSNIFNAQTRIVDFVGRKDPAKYNKMAKLTISSTEANILASSGYRISLQENPSSIYPTMARIEYHGEPDGRDKVNELYDFVTSL